MKKQTTLVLLASVVAGCTTVDISEYQNNPDMPIVMGNYFQTLPNSIGGVKFSLYGYNNSDKTIRYVYFDMKHRNRDHEVIQDDVSKLQLKSYMFVGPFASHSKFDREFGPHFYNQAATCVELEEVRVEYMDGTTLNLSGKALSKTFAFTGSTCRNMTEHQFPYQS